MRDLHLGSLRLFVAVCDLRSLSRAAVLENLTPSAVSKRIALLEQSVGTPLFKRDRHGAQPTPAGQAFLEHARVILLTVGRIEGDMLAFDQGAEGHVKLVASASAIAQSLLDDVAAFLSADGNQEIRVDIEEKRSTEIVQAVREGIASVGVCWDQADMSTLEHRPYRRDSLALVVPPEHPLASRKSLRFDQTLGYQHVGLQANSAVQVLLQRAAAHAGKPLIFRAIVSNFDAAFRIVAARLAISVVPVEVSFPYAQILNLKVIPLIDSWANRQFTICSQRLSTLQPAARRMVEHLARMADSPIEPPPSQRRSRPPPSTIEIPRPPN